MAAELAGRGRRFDPGALMVDARRVHGLVIEPVSYGRTILLCVVALCF